MSFDAPKALWLLLLLIPVAAICFARLTPDGIVPSHLLFGRRKRHLNRRLLARLCILCAMGCLIIELAEPRLQGSGASGQREGTAALVLDLSGSMEARGLKEGSKEPTEANLTGSRLEMAKSIAINLLDKLPERNIALVGFARRAFMVSPVTRSVATLKERISELEILEYEDGTAISDALACACRTLEQVPSSALRRIYLVSDGADHSDAASRQEVVEMLCNAKISLYPIVVGADYTYHSMRDSKGNLTWQANGEKADVTMIKELASKTGGHVFTLDEIAGEGDSPSNAFNWNGFCIFVATLFLVLAGLLGFW